ncbi:hypothetical protein EON68_02285 [archaeon]|nr:MAG: hypothetical protein EON68_02285 [archaeon]
MADDFAELDAALEAAAHEAPLIGGGASVHVEHGGTTLASRPQAAASRPLVAGSAALPLKPDCEASNLELLAVELEMERQYASELEARCAVRCCMRGGVANARKEARTHARTRVRPRMRAWCGVCACLHACLHCARVCRS